MPLPRRVACMVMGVFFGFLGLGCGGGRNDGEGLRTGPPRNPSLSAGYWPMYQRDSYATHSARERHVTGDGDIEVTLADFGGGLVIFPLLDATGHLVAVANGLEGAFVHRRDAVTLAPVARGEIQTVGGILAGQYIYLDAQERPVVGGGGRIDRYALGAPTLEVEHRFEVRPHIDADDNLAAVSPLYSGEISFATLNGCVGLIDAGLTRILAKLCFPGEKISNGHAVDEEGGLYVVTSVALRRLQWDGAQLHEAWRVDVPALTDKPRPGRLGIGSGTTPGLVDDDLVVIADDAKVMNVLVIDRRLGTTGDRVRCRVPPFPEQPESTTDNAISIAGRSLLVTQNLTGKPGVARIDILSDGSCRRRWMAEVDAPTCVPTVSEGANRAYVYTPLRPRPDAPPQEIDWALTGLDWDTGALRFQKVVGRGRGYNNFYSAITLTPDGRVLVGTFHGLAVFRDVPSTGSR